jgi:hypothetical protein
MVRFVMALFMALFVAVVASVPATADSFQFGYSSGYRHHGYRSWGHHPGWGHHHHYRPRSSVFLYSGPSYVYAPPPRVIYYDTYAPIVRPTGQCTVFNGDAVIDGSGQPFYGRACIFTDGRWHIVP